MATDQAEPMELLYMRNPYHELVDSLAFVDAVPQELEGTIKELIESEKKAILEEFDGDENQLLESYVVPLPPMPDHTDSGHLYHEEVTRKAAGKPLEALDLSRYIGNAEGKDVEARIDHMKVLLEYVRGAQVNLEIMDRYKEAAWLKHLEELAEMRSSLEKVKTGLTSEIEQVSKVRKLNNIENANRLRQIGQEYEEYQRKNKQLLLAVEQLQNSQANVSSED